MTEPVKSANSPVNEPVNVDVKLGINKFHVDEGHPHIIIREHPDMAAFHTLTLACPAGRI